MSDLEKIQNFKQQMLAKLGNGIFTELSFLEDESLTSAEKEDILTLGLNISMSSGLKRWEQYFQKKIGDLGDDVSFENKQNQLIGAIHSRNLQKSLNAYSKLDNIRHTLNDRSLFEYKLLNLCKDKSDLNDFFDTLNFSQPQDFKDFIERGNTSLPHALAHSGSPLRNVAILRQIIEQAELSDKEADYIFQNLTKELCHVDVLLSIMELFGDKVTHFSTGSSSSILKIFNYVDSEELAPTINELIKYKDKLDISSEFVKVIIDSAITDCNDLGYSRNGSDALITDIWDSVSHLLFPEHLKDATEAVCKHEFDIKLCYGFKQVELIEKLLPEAIITLNQPRILHNFEEKYSADIDTFKELVLEKFKSNPRLFNNPDGFFDLESKSTNFNI